MSALLVHQVRNNIDQLLDILESGVLHPRKRLPKGKYEIIKYDGASHQYVFLTAGTVAGGLVPFSLLLAREALSGPFFMRRNWGGGKLSGAQAFAAKDRGLAIRRARRLARDYFVRWPLGRRVEGSWMLEKIIVKEYYERAGKPPPPPRAWNSATLRGYTEALSHEFFIARSIRLAPFLKGVVLRKDMPDFNSKVEKLVKERYPAVQVFKV